MKQLTKEEFLDKKNTKIHDELMSVFNDKVMSNELTNYYHRALSDNRFLFCSVKPSSVFLRSQVRYGYQLLFIDLIEMLKSGELVFKEK